MARLPQSRLIGALTLLAAAAAQAQDVTVYDDASLVAGGAPPPNLMQIERDVTVASMVSDRFTWSDASNQSRVAVLAHNDGQLGPTAAGGYTNHGGALREFRYQLPGNVTRICGVTTTGNAGFGGFGYVVSHRGDGSAGIAADDSPLGYAFTGSFQRVFEGRHHAIFRFTQLYPRYSSTTANPANTLYNVPVTIDWVFSTGHDNPLWALTWDLSGVPADALNDDSRAPYGELLFDGAASEATQSTVAGVGWGDRYKFASTTNPVTMNSAWTWNVANTIPYVKLWTTAVDATIGTVQTQTITQQDAGGYWGTHRWNTTSAGGNACTVATGGVDQLMPCNFNWPYQSINYSLSGVSTPTSNSRLAWGTNFGFLGQTQYLTQGSAYYGGPLPDTTAPGWPRKSYSTYVVLGLRSSAPVEAQVAQVETVQSLALSATIGSVVASGPAGAGRTDDVTYTPAGYNHVYGALAFAAGGNSLDANIAVGTGTLKKPLLILGSYTGSYPTVKLGGVTLVSDVDYFPSLRAGASELWITLNFDLVGGTNHIEVLPSCSPVPTPTIQASGPTALCAGESVTLTASIAPGAGVSYLWSPGGETTQAVNMTASGSYSVTVIVSGCAGTSPATAVMVSPIPATPAAGNGGPYYAGATVSLTASAVAGATYAWTGPNSFTSTLQNPTIPAATTAATGTYGVTATVDGCTSPAGTTSVVVTGTSAVFYPASPCRLFDTRNSSGPDVASPALGAGETRTLTIGGRCSLPASAKAISVNQTVTGQTANGELLLYRGDIAVAPTASSISFAVGKTRANNGILELARDGSGTFKVFNNSTGTVHFILDVNGYFQ